jgi:hypothetical protein
MVQDKAVISQAYQVTLYWSRVQHGTKAPRVLWIFQSLALGFWRTSSTLASLSACESVPRLAKKRNRSGATCRVEGHSANNGRFPGDPES